MAHAAVLTPYRYTRTPLQRSILQKWIDAARHNVEEAKSGGNPDAIRAAEAAYDELLIEVSRL